MCSNLIAFYDDLSEHCHRIFGEWDQAVLRQADVLDGLLQQHLTTPPDRVSLLDCSCGIGTQAIGLALLGYRVHGTDLSPKAVERARVEAQRLGATVTFGVADFRAISREVQGSFDVVLSCDNALPHLKDDDDLLLAAQNMRSKLRNGGLLVIGMRDYDRISQERPRSTPVGIAKGPDGTSIVFQIWDWAEDGRTYRFDHFIVYETQNGWETHHGSGEYRALRREELTEIIDQAGFDDVSWHGPSETGYREQVVTARAV